LSAAANLTLIKKIGEENPIKCINSLYTGYLEYEQNDRLIFFYNEVK